MKLGSLIAMLSACNPEAAVEFPLGIRPTKLASYRGYYEDLALGYMDYWDANQYAQGEFPPRPTVADLHAECVQAVGKVYEGYKGGDFKMDKHTRVWVANVGSGGGWQLSGVHPQDDDWVLLLVAPPER